MHTLYTYGWQLYTRRLYACLLVIDSSYGVTRVLRTLSTLYGSTVSRVRVKYGVLEIGVWGSPT